MAMTRKLDHKSNVSFCNYHERESDFVLTLMIDATRRCQLRCRYCYFGEKSNEDMQISRVFQAIRNFVGVFGSKLRRVEFNYMGGEPLLSWNNILALNAISREYFSERSIQFSWAMTSNLIALDERKAEHMIAERAGIHCSIDGPAFIHDRNRPFRNGKPSLRHCERHGLPRRCQALAPNSGNCLWPRI